jgi:hypothetical protein
MKLVLGACLVLYLGALRLRHSAAKSRHTLPLAAPVRFIACHSSPHARIALRS